MSIINFPDQTIPESKKDKDWHIDHALAYASFSITSSYDEQKKEMLKLYRGYNGELSNEERELAKTITCPHGVSLGIEYVVYPLIQSKVEQLVGEYFARPIQRFPYVVDKRSKNEKFEAKVKMLAEEFMREVNQKVSQNLGYQAQTANPEMTIPEDVDAFFENDFKTQAEMIAKSILDIFLDARNEKKKFSELLVDFCIVDRAHAVLDFEDGFTTLRKVHPLDADYDIDPYKVVQDNHDYFFENYYLTENQIYNTFDLGKKDKEKVREYFKGMANIDNANTESDQLGFSQKYNGWYRTANKTNRMRLVVAKWKSRKKVSIKQSVDNYGNEHYNKLSEDYKPRKKDKIETIEGEMPHHVIMLGPEICLGWGPMDERFSHVDNQFACELPLVSIIRDNTAGTSLIKSIGAKLYQLQQMASEILFEIRLALKNAGDSRVLVYDAAQTPKQFTKEGYENGLNRVMHHIKKDKLLIYNSGERKNQNTNAKFFDSLDLSQKGGIQDLFNGLAIIEDLASKFTGLMPEREGQVGQYQTATGTDKAIRGSFARTEIIFHPFDLFVKSILEKVLLRAKYDYEEGEVLHYIIGKYKTKFLMMFKDFFLADYGIYLSDGSKDREMAETINRAAEQALATSNTPEAIMGLIEVFEGESASEKKMVFKAMIDSMNKMREEAMKAQAEQAEAAQQAEQAKLDREDQLKREGFANNIDVAEIYVQGKGYSDVLKTTSQERIKAAELELEQVKENQKQLEKAN